MGGVVSGKQTKRRNGKGETSQPAAAPAATSSLSPDATLVKVAVMFFAIFAVLQVALWALVYQGYFTPVMEWTAGITGACSIATGVPATVVANDVVLESRILRIDADCTGITLMMIYAALVLAYPLSWKKKLLGLVGGIAVLFVANLIRLVAVAQLSGPLDDRAFLFVHDYLFKIVMMGVVIGAWAVYLSSAKRHAS